MFHNLFGKFLFLSHLDKNDKIVYIAHQHPVLLVRPTLMWLLFGIAIPLFMYFSNPTNMGVVVTAGVVAAIFAMKFFLRFTIWFFDCWVVTTKGIMDFQWKSFFFRKIIHIAYDSLDGVSTEINGFWNTILRKGTVHIVRITDGNHVTLENAYRPRKVERLVQRAQYKMQEHRAVEAQEREANNEEIKALLADMLHEHAEKKGINLKK